MTLILCIDNSGGMLFQSKRQSMDRNLRRRIRALLGDFPLTVSSYSAKMFSEEGPLKITDDFSFSDDDVYFMEDGPMPDRKCDTVILYRWNRDYPADRFFSMDLSQMGLVLSSRTDFEGSSHKKITEEIYRVQP